MQEYWDVLDEQGNKTGRTMLRGEEMRPGDYHLIVHIWILNERNEYLIQKRADHLESLPGVWATTGGCVVAGEESLAGVIRETEEEVGITLLASSLSRLSRITGKNAMADIWLAHVQSSDLHGVTPGEEVSEVQWASKDSINQMIRSGEFHDYGYLEDLLP